MTVDAGWHAFILHTREYAEFCDTIARRFIHHTPDDGDHRGAALQVTVEAMRTTGYAPDLALWFGDDAAAKCTQCYRGCHDSSV